MKAEGENRSGATAVNGKQLKLSESLARENASKQGYLRVQSVATLLF
jgi:hypothetical protein